MPQPLNMSGDIRCPATAAALSSSTIPVHRQCPMFEVSASTRCLSRSRARAYQPRSGSQYVALKAALSRLASSYQRVAVCSSPARSAMRARATYAP
jgi:hypothetical protein